MKRIIYKKNNNYSVEVAEVKNRFNLVKTSYNSDDVTVLLKDLSNVMKEQSAEERERMIQSGTHYSEMLPMENEPSAEYKRLYDEALDRNSHDVAQQVIALAHAMLDKAHGGKVVIVSLARAGIPVGVLINRYINTYIENGRASHYAISIIRDKGIDVNAMNFIYDEEVRGGNAEVSNIFFVDGWTGKGVIKKQLDEAVEQLKRMNNDKWHSLSNDLYVLADPANVTPYCGTREDYLLPSACLNSTVSGLMSRTILNKYVDEAAGEFHGAVYFKKFEGIDVTNQFIDRVCDEIYKIKASVHGFDEFLNTFAKCPLLIDAGWSGMSVVNSICNKYGIADYKKVKPGIGETTRVLLRRVPWKVFINKNIDKNDPDIAHIFELCEEKNVAIEYEELGHYKVCGVIKDLSADA